MAGLNVSGATASTKRSEVAMAGRAKTKTPGRKSRSTWPPSKQRLRELVAEAIVDAYDEAEQRIGFFTMIEDNLALPFETEVLGVPVKVERVECTEANEIVAVCRRATARQRIAVLELPLPQPPPAGAEWIEAYRRWARGA